MESSFRHTFPCFPCNFLPSCCPLIIPLPRHFFQSIDLAMLPITSALRISKSMQPSEVMDTNNPPESQMSSSVDCDNNPPESQMPSSVDGENIPPDTQMPSSVDAVKDAQAFANEYLRMDPPRPQGRLIVCRLLKVHLQKAIEHAQRRRMSLELSNSYNDSNADLDHVIFVRRVRGDPLLSVH